MRKLILSSVLLALANFANAQLYVNPGAYVFMTNQFMYVKQDVNLQNTSNFYMRNTAQLLQGTTGSSTNFGAGKLSVFQEGTVNNYQYNYWCSPVGAASGVTGNEQFSISLLNRPTGLITSVPATMLSSYDGTSSPLGIATYWIWKFVTSNAYAQWVHVGSATSINPGEGFTMKGTSGTDATVVDADGVQNNTGSKQRYDFRGKPNDGNISVPVSAGNFTLVGNPYPSAIDLNQFLLDPANAAVTNGQAYFWEQVVVNSHYIDAYSGGYGVYNPGTGVYTPAAFWNYNGAGGQETALGSGTVFQRRFSPIGQGFMVMGTAAGSVTMKNSYRVFVREGAVNQSEFARMGSAAAQNQTADVYAGNSEFFPEIPNVAGIDYTKIKKGTSPYIRIHAMYNNGGVRPTTIAFDDNATDGFDYGFDGRSPSSEAAEFYYIVNGTENEYVATAVKFDVEKKIPVGLRCAQQTNFKIKVAGLGGNFNANQEIYLHDKETGVYYDIKNGTFDMTLPAGNNKTRFEITFKNFSLSNENANLADNFDVYQNNAAGTLTIVNTMNKDVVSCQLFDVTGKLVIAKKNLGKNDTIEVSTSGLSDGVYIVKLDTKESGSVDKKIIIAKK